MTRRAIVLAAGVTLAALTLATAARAGGRMLSAMPVNVKAQSDFRPKSAFGSPGGFPFRSVQDHRAVPRVFPRHQFFPRFVNTGFAYLPPAFYGPPADTTPQVVSVDPVIYASPVVYVSTPVVAPQPVSVAAPAAPPPMPTVVEYQTGRYELRGDGAGTPYAWVWIPNPPSAPPVASPAREESLPPRTSTASQSQVYRWTDDQGTEFFTNRVDKVPKPYRSGSTGPSQVVAQE
jgi:Domain of unknown function (DUF4124)